MKMFALHFGCFLIAALGIAFMQGITLLLQSYYHPKRTPWFADQAESISSRDRFRMKLNSVTFSLHRLENILLRATRLFASWTTVREMSAQRTLANFKTDHLEQRSRRFP